jgi:HSP20 family molecular chaperone IbpA
MKYSKYYTTTPFSVNSIKGYPLSDFSFLGRLIDRKLNGALNSTSTLAAVCRDPGPQIDICSLDNGIKIIVDVPGNPDTSLELKHEQSKTYLQLDVSYNDNNNEEYDFIVNERPKREQSTRKIYLNTTMLDSEKIEVTKENGLIEVFIPKQVTAETTSKRLL